MPSAEHNLEMARHVEPLEQVIDCLISAAKSTHVERLQSGQVHDPERLRAQ